VRFLHPNFLSVSKSPLGNLINYIYILKIEGKFTEIFEFEVEFEPAAALCSGELKKLSCGSFFRQVSEAIEINSPHT
jgi:hypothetical protein